MTEKKADSQQSLFISALNNTGIATTLAMKASLLALLIVLGVTCYIYNSGLFGPFLLDDYYSIIKNGRIAIHDLRIQSLTNAASSLGQSLFQRPVSMLSFAVNYYLTGFSAYYFKVFNLAIHLFNGIGIFLLTRHILHTYHQRTYSSASKSQAQWISLAIAAAWLFHPLNLSPVLYVVQRMTLLAAFFNIWGMIVFTWGRIRLTEGKSGIALICASLLFFMPLATLSKENGILMPLMMFILEITFFQFQTQKTEARRFLIVLYAATIVLPALALSGYTLLHPDWISRTYQTRDFTLSERLMTEARVMWFYIKQIILPENAKLALFHDDIAISRGLLEPVSTLISITGLMALAGFSFLMRKKAPLISFGILFFLSGHVLESTVWPLEIAYEHRNYFPMFGILLILFYYLLFPLGSVRLAYLRQGVAVLLIGLFAFNTYSRAQQWSNPYDFAETEARNHPRSLRANLELANLYASLHSNDARAMDAYYLKARTHYESMSTIDPNDVHGLIGLIVLNGSRGKTIEAEWTQKLEYRLRHTPVFPIALSKKLDALVTCYLNQVCKLGKGELEAVIRASLENPALTGIRRAEAYSALSYFLLNVNQDPSGALKAMRMAVETAPQEIQYRLTYASLLAAMQLDSEAKEQTRIAKNLDKLHIHAVRISQLEKQNSDNKNDDRHEQPDSYPAR